MQLKFFHKAVAFFYSFLIPKTFDSVLFLCVKKKIKLTSVLFTSLDIEQQINSATHKIKTLTKQQDINSSLVAKASRLHKLHTLGIISCKMHFGCFSIHIFVLQDSVIVTYETSLGSSSKACFSIISLSSHNKFIHSHF